MAGKPSIFLNVNAVYGEWHIG